MPRDFRWILVGRFATRIGDYMFLPAILAASQHYPWVIPLIGLAFYFPPFVAAPLGAWVDRGFHRRLAIGADSASALAIGILIVALLWEPRDIPLALLLAVFISELSGTLYASASNRLIRDFITDGFPSTKAGSWVDTANTAGQLVGLVAGFFGLAIFRTLLPVAIVNASSFGVSLITTMFVAVPTIKHPVVEKFSQSIMTGFRILIQKRLLLALALSAAVMNLGGSAFLTMLAVWERAVVPHDAQWGRSVIIAWTVGGMVFSQVTAHIKKLPSALWLVSGGALIQAVSLGAMGAFPALVVGLSAAFVIGIGSALASVGIFAAIQDSPEKEVLGTVSGAFNTLSRVTQIVGASALPMLALGTISLRTGYAMAGATMIVGVLLLLILGRQSRPTVTTPTQNADNAIQESSR
jgi:MFS family permease